jgi:hypothetical protein
MVLQMMHPFKSLVCPFDWPNPITFIIPGMVFAGWHHEPIAAELMRPLSPPSNSISMETSKSERNDDGNL